MEKEEEEKEEVVSGSLAETSAIDSGEIEWTIIIDHGLTKRYLGYGWIRYCKFTFCSYFLNFYFNTYF